MKQNIGAPAIIGAVVLVGVLLFVLYKMTLAPKGPDPAAAAPEHKDMAQFYRNQGRVGNSAGQGGGPSGGGGQAAPR